ncbi:MAG: hypothetical protein JRM88_07135 [Nitrososphaerota archaeon]|jgi:hypothetical protein|nr:hypothetical protein [Nitrososphaerota archaeon]
MGGTRNIVLAAVAFATYAISIFTLSSPALYPSCGIQAAHDVPSKDLA